MINLAFLIHSNLYYELLTKRLKSEKDINIVGRLINEDELINFIEESNIDVIFVDSLIPNLNLTSLMEKIDDVDSNIGLVVLFHFNDLDMLIQAISSGIDACLNIDSTYVELLQAIRTVKEGGIWANNEVLTTALKRFINKSEKPLKQLSNSLTKRETEIAELIYQGLSNKAIANKLYISDKTVKTHISHIFKKLGIKHRYQLNPHFLDSFVQFKSIKT